MNKTNNDMLTNKTNAMKKKHQEEEVKTVNVPLSESNAKQPEAGVQIPVAASETETIEQTDAYSPTHTREQAIPKGVDKDDLPERFDALRETFNMVLDRHIMDTGQKDEYLIRAGLKK